MKTIRTATTTDGPGPRHGGRSRRTAALGALAAAGLALGGATAHATTQPGASTATAGATAGQLSGAAAEPDRKAPEPKPSADAKPLPPGPGPAPAPEDDVELPSATQVATVVAQVAPRFSRLPGDAGTGVGKAGGDALKLAYRVDGADASIGVRRSGDPDAEAAWAADLAASVGEQKGTRTLQLGGGARAHVVDGRGTAPSVEVYTVDGVAVGVAGGPRSSVRELVALALAVAEA